MRTDGNRQMVNNYNPNRHSRFHLDRPLRVMFLITDMRVGGAETVTANIIRRIDPERFLPELCCLKERGALGDVLAKEIPVHHGLLRHKFDLRVWPRLTRLLRQRQIDAVVTVGAGDKMFWGRLAARHVGIPVILSALHSTGWPDGVGRLNRLLTPITDAFIAVAQSHGRFLVEHECFPAAKVAVIPNGVDIQRFIPNPDVAALRRELGIAPLATGPSPRTDTHFPLQKQPEHVIGIVAALRPEKNHELFLEIARRVLQERPATRFLIVGDGPCREPLLKRTRELGLDSHVSFLGSRNDIPQLLAALDVFVLTSHNEANPISILEAMSTALPVVATDVGSIHEVICDGVNGFLVQPGDANALTQRVLKLLSDRSYSQQIGTAARETIVRSWSLDAMVRGYEHLIESVYSSKLSCVGEPQFIETSDAIASNAVVG